MNCANSPFGPPDATGAIFIPYTESSNRFPWAGGSSNYQNNVDYNWQAWFSGNVTSAAMVFQAAAPGFHTEPFFDYLYLSNSNNSTVLSLNGNLDQGNTVGYASQPVPFNFAIFPNDNYMNLEWKSDYSVNYAGWTIAGFKVRCDRINQPAGSAANVSRLHNNDQRDGVLLGSGDIRYFSTVQQADRDLLLHLRQDNTPGPHADYDLYASTSALTTTPDPTHYQYRSFRGLKSDGTMNEDFIYIPATGVAHYVYFSVHGYLVDKTHAGGYRVYENTIGNKIASWNVNTDFDDRNGTCGNVTQTVQNAISADISGLYQATDGTALVRNINFWHNAPDGSQNGYCSGQGCQIVYSGCSCTNTCMAPDTYYGFAGTCNFAGGGRIVDRSWAGSPVTDGWLMSHEMGHALYGFAEEYVNGGAGYVDGHSVMNGPQANASDYCTGTTASCTLGPLNGTGNHGADCFNQGGQLPVYNTGNWGMLSACFPGQTRDYQPTGTPNTPDPEQWTNPNEPFVPPGTMASDIWFYTDGDHPTPIVTITNFF
jgi:hypothetical protein